jgi:hypothetical protein
MTTNFPTSLDSFTNPTPSNYLNSPSHAGQHANINDAMAAVQSKLGITSSSDSTSIDYKLSNLYSAVQRQAIINGGMEISQENGASTVALVNNTAKYACDLFSVTPSGTAVLAGTQAQISNSTIGTSGYALKLAGVTITGAGTIKKRYRIEAADAVKYKNKAASFSMLELQDTGGSLNYTIQINKANSADNFSAVTQIAISGNLVVPTGVGTLIKFENVAMGDCSNGIEICVTIPCGAITTKNFETTEWQMNVGAVALSFVCGTMCEELTKVLRYYEKFDSPSISVGAGCYSSTTTADAVFSYFPKRVDPTLSFSNANQFRARYGGGASAGSAISYGDPTKTSCIVTLTVSANTLGIACYIQRNDTSNPWIAVDARFPA